MGYGVASQAQTYLDLLLAVTIAQGTFHFDVLFLLSATFLANHSMKMLGSMASGFSALSASNSMFTELGC